MVCSKSGGGAGLGVVVMSYNDGVSRNYKDNPVKVVFRVPNASESIARLEQIGTTIVQQVSQVPQLNGAQVGVAKDPDGYALEFVQL